MKGGTLALIAAATLAMSQAAWAGERTINLKIDGMSCGMCPPAAKKALEGVNGVKSAQVMLEDGKAVVVADEAIKDTDLVKAVEEAGHGFKAQVITAQ